MQQIAMAFEYIYKLTIQLKVFRYSFSEVISIFFKRLESCFYLVCLIATKFLPVIDYELKFVKMQLLVKSISL